MQRLNDGFTSSQFKSFFQRARKAENFYAAQLRKVARHIGDIIKGFDVSKSDESVFLQSSLSRYANLIEPWANSTAKRMIAEVEARDMEAWRRHSKVMGVELRKEIETAPVGQVMREILVDQVKLIKSLPLEAASRVSKLSREAIYSGTRADVLAKDILRTGEVSKARANTIARTETSRAQTTLTQVRAQSIGSTQFIWRTSGDSDVRASHKRLNGRVFEWDNPPECDDGVNALPGCVFNCRCFAVPILPED